MANSGCGTVAIIGHAADKPRRNARAIRDREGNEAGEHGDEQVKRRTAADQAQSGSQRALLVTRVNATYGKSERDSETARDHDRQHVGNAGHEMFVRAGAGSGALRFRMLDRF